MGGIHTFKIGRMGPRSIGAAVFFVAFLVFVAPLLRHHAQLRAAIADVRGQISQSRSELGAIRDLQKKAATAQVELHSLDSDLPAGPPVVGIPLLVKAHFDRLGFANSTTTLKSTSNEPRLPGYQRMNWSVTIPVQNVAKQAGDLLAAVAALDQSQPDIHVVDLEIPREAEATGKYGAIFHFSMLARK